MNSTPAAQPATGADLEPSHLKTSGAPARFGRPPLPREHGAWVIVYAPMVIVFASVALFTWQRAALLLLTVTGLFLARTALTGRLRRSAGPSTGNWLAIYLTLAVIGAASLIVGYGLWSLLRLGCLAVILFAAHSLLGVIPARKRLERSQWGELLAVCALTLTAPAAYVAAVGRLDGVAWCLWAICALYFSSGILFVHTILRAIKVNGLFGWRERWRVGYGLVIYHVLLLAVIGLVTLMMSGLGAVLSSIAYLPALIRAFVGWMTLTNKTPSFKRIGLGETFYAVWFVVFMILSLRIGL